MTVIEIIINSGKYTTVNCVIKNLTKDSIVYKQNVFQILKKNGIVADNFDDYFEAGLQKLIKSLTKKRYLTGVKRLFNCNTIKGAIQLIIQKLVSNTRNEMDGNRINSLHKEISNYNKNEYINQIEEQQNEELIIEDLKKIAKKYPKKVEILLEDSGFDHDTIRDLCNKIGINFENLDLTNTLNCEVKLEEQKINNKVIYQMLLEF